jgi:peptidoglycan/xylan/chitin deacetylase (PgdA/CDA1 family)/glycosyltransferase involved in cell wall biosynthesis
MSANRVVCLLPVRNGEADLPGYLAAVAGVADAVVALDDGSTDRTAEVLAASPLVARLLRNPPRPDYSGWDDAANRNRLLSAAADLEPAWILSLDADERIPADDAAALRAFVQTEALPGCAYGFKVFRMWQDLAHYDRAGLWVFRLFAYDVDQRFPARRLHFVPIPTTIPPQRWLRTTIRIQHLAGLTAARRQARFTKYRQADPDHAFQHSYQDLLAAVGPLAPWLPRPPGLPVLDVQTDRVLAARQDYDQPALTDITDRPALSAIIISRDDGERIVPSVAAVVGQECPWPFEVIVVTSGSGDAAEIVRERFPTVRVVELPQPAFPGVARNAGLRVASGEYVSFPGSHVELLPGSLTARLRAHDLGYAMVTGTTLNGTRTRSGWASYFLDHSAVLPGRPSTELGAAPSHCSYRRSALLTVGGFPEHLRAGEDTVVNQELMRRGYLAYRAQDVTLVHRSPCHTLGTLIRHHFIRGRGFGRILRERDGVVGRTLLNRGGINLVRRQVGGRIAHTTRNVLQWNGDPGLMAEYRRSFPFVVCGAVAACAGTWYELFRIPAPAPQVSAPLVGAPGSNRGTRVPILTYHHLDRPDSDWSVSTAQLEGQIGWLVDQGYTSITVSGLLDAIIHGMTLPERPVIITNDDGHPETMRFAEILQQRGFVATYFLPSRTSLSADQIRSLDRSGEVGGHTVTHADLGRLGAEGQRSEIADNKRCLEDIIGRRMRSFAYPYGSSTPDTVRILREAGYDGAVLAGNATAPTQFVDQYQLPRLPVLGSRCLAEFASRLREVSPGRTDTQRSTERVVLPLDRIVAFSGHPQLKALGILGQHDRATMLVKLREQAAQYEEADPTHPVLPALNLIAATAQKTAGADGLFRRRTPPDVLNDYADFTMAHDLLLILDVQPGLAALIDEIEWLRPWLQLPHVHLALDPEWSVNQNHVPGTVVGVIDADQIRAVQATLAELVHQHRLPTKLLVVHQFRRSMIGQRSTLSSRPEVQLVIDADGVGAPIGKINTYNALVKYEQIGHPGFKLFFKQDHPLMTVKQVLSLAPPPSVVIYQ